MPTRPDVDALAQTVREGLGEHGRIYVGNEDIEHTRGRCNRCLADSALDTLADLAREGVCPPHVESAA